MDFAFWLDNEVVGAMKAGLSGTMAWNLCLDQQGGPKNVSAVSVQGITMPDNIQICGGDRCLGMVTIDHSQKPAAFTYNVPYQALTLLSKITVPGSHMIGFEKTGLENVDVLAFDNPDLSYSVLLRNLSDSEQVVKVQTKKGEFTLAHVPSKGLVTLRWSHEVVTP